MSEQETVFNLIHEPWLPVWRRSGAVESIPPWRITDRIEEDPCVAFAWPRPDFNGAAHELLIGLLATAAAPEDDEAWADWWHCPPPPGTLRQRFDSVAHAFDLDGPGPRFLQDLDPLEGSEDKEIATLLIDAPGAQTLRHNADLFVKRGGVPVLSRAAVAMALFTLSSYAPSGGAGHRTSLRGGGPMTTLSVADHPTCGSTLWGRLWPNVESRVSLEASVNSAMRKGDDEKVFPWLSATRTSNPKAGGRTTTPDDVHPFQMYWGMPRRIRLLFQDAEGRECGLTSTRDHIVAASYRTRNYGIDYSEGFQHPLAPYYRQSAKKVTWLPVHPRPGGVSYRLWPGLVVQSRDGLRQPARVIRRWGEARARMARATGGNTSRFVAFGYDMDNMKARAWIESEMPLWLADGDAHEWLAGFINRAITGADTVGRLLTSAVKSAWYDNPKNAPGDYGFIAERFFRETEGAFYDALDETLGLIQAQPDCDDPSLTAREHWAPSMEKAALWLFDEYAPSEGLEDRDMHRHVKAQFQLTLALRGHGKVGKSLFENDLGIAAPQTTRSRRREQEAA